MEKEKVIVIGAGITGLFIAAELADEYDVVVLEASDRAGGRIQSISSASFPGVIEGGAEFLHGSTKNTRQLLKKAGIGVVKVSGEMYRRDKGKWVEQEEMVEGWDDVLDKIGSLEEDITLKDFISEYYSGEQNAALRARIINYAEGFDCVDISDASVKSLHQEWSHEGSQYRVKGGYGKLIDYLLEQCRQKGCAVHFNSVVQQLEWQPGKVIALTKEGKVYTAVKGIITAPISVLRLGESRAGITIKPEPPNYSAALQDIGYGNVVKVVMQFGKCLWPDDAAFMFTDEDFPTWWTQLPSHAPVLTCWAGGSRAHQLSQYDDAQLLDIALSLMAKIFDLPRREVNKQLRAARVFNWGRVDTSLGSYSYATPQSENARRQLLTPVEGTLYFSGEGLYYGPYPGTVEAAIVAARYTIQRVKKAAV